MISAEDSHICPKSEKAQEIKIFKRKGALFEKKIACGASFKELSIKN